MLSNGCYPDLQKLSVCEELVNLRHQYYCLTNRSFKQTEIYRTVTVVSVFSSNSSLPRKRASVFPILNSRCSSRGVPNLAVLSMCVYAHAPAHTLCGFSVLDGSIQDIRACQSLGRKRWESSVFKGQESYVELPLFTPVTKWTGLDTNCLPTRSPAKSNGTDGKRKRDAAYFYSVHLLPRPQTRHNINTEAHELVACYVCDLRLYNTMKDWVHKDMGNNFSKYLDVV